MYRADYCLKHFKLVFYIIVTVYHVKAVLDDIPATTVPI